jgi:segregation and condensation protein B
MARPVDPDLDRERADLPPGQRWREGMRRIEAVLFASATPVARDDLAKLAGQEPAVDQLIGDLAINLGGAAPMTWPGWPPAGCCAAGQPVPR